MFFNNTLGKKNRPSRRDDGSFTKEDSQERKAVGARKIGKQTLLRKRPQAWFELLQKREPKS